MMWPCRNLLIIVLLMVCSLAYAQQQDVEFHPNGIFLQGKSILKVKRDFNDPYLWVLAKNNEVYRINSVTMAVDNYTSQFAAYNNLQFIDIAGRSQDTVFIATNSTNVIEYKKGILRTIGPADGLTDMVNSVGMASLSSLIAYGSLEIGTTRGRAEYNPVTEQLRYIIFDGEIDGMIFDATYRNFTAKENSYDSYLPKLIPISRYGNIGAALLEISPNAESGQNVITAYGTSPYLISPGSGASYEESVF